MQILDQNTKGSWGEWRNVRVVRPKGVADGWMDVNTTSY